MSRDNKQLPLFPERRGTASKKEAARFSEKFPEAVQFSCISCGAQPGEPCTFLKHSGATKRPHVDRIKAVELRAENLKYEFFGV